MRVAVAFQNERLELEVPEGRLVGRREGPAGSGPGESAALVRAAVEHARDFPPLRQAVVPGDHVVIALDPEVPEPLAVLRALAEVLQEVGVEPGSTTVLVPRTDPSLAADRLPEGLSLVVHDPDDRKELAYLASTEAGRRVYLNRRLTDADFVLPVGRLGYDPVLGYRGPWSLLFPGLGDRETQTAYRALATPHRPDRERPATALAESGEVSWLLGSQFQLGLLAGVSGFVEAVAGAEAMVRDQGTRAVDQYWSFEAESRAELVVVGVGTPDRPTRIDDLSQALATASHLVQRGGKVVALSRAQGGLGPALRRLIGAGDPRAGSAALCGHESDPDFIAARQLALALDWSDVYLLSGLPADDVDDLSIVPLGKPEEVRRLVASSGSCLVVSQADLTRASVSGESE